VAIIAVPASQAVEVLRACGDKGVGFAVMFTAGFAEVGDDGVSVGPLTVPYAADVAKRLAREDALQLGIRPEYVEASSQPLEGGTEATVEDVDTTGHSLIVHARMGESTFKVTMDESTSVARGDTLSIRFPVERVNLYADGERLEVDA
jgi:ABC-type sugar transport system ATPase subunit